MLRFLLDEYLSPHIVEAVHAIRQEVGVVSHQQWEGGQYLGSDDSVVLGRAAEQGLTLVTYDQKTIAPLLVYWGQIGVSHGGVVFGSAHTIPASDVGAIARALVQVWQTHGDQEWADRVVYLTTAP